MGGTEELARFATLLGLGVCELFLGCGGATNTDASVANGGSSAAGGAATGSGGTTTGSGGTTTGSGGTTTGSGGTTTGSGGTSLTGTAGSTCGPKCSAPSPCAPYVIASGLTALTDFSTNLDSGGIFHTGGASDWTSLYGGFWVSPIAVDPCRTTPATYPLAQSLTAGNWRITGTIGNQWAGAGVWLSGGCGVKDFSAYQGISFTIAGNAGPSGSINVTVGTASNSAPITDTTSGNFTCDSNAATCTATACASASATVSNITAAPQTVRVLWADLTNGAPAPTPNPAEITSIGINPTIDWAGTAAPYQLDLIIDDLALIP